MKILYVIHQFFPEFGSGTEVITQHIASMMQKNGNKIKVVAYSPTEDPSWTEYETVADIQFRQIMYQSIPIIQYRHIVQPADITYGFHNDHVMQFAHLILEREQPDVVHLTHLMRGTSFAEAANSMKIPFIATLTDLMAVCPHITMQNKDGKLCESVDATHHCQQVCKDGIRYAKRLDEIRKILSKAASITAPSAFIQNKIGDELKLPIKVIPHGICFSENATVKEKKRKGKAKQLAVGFTGSLIQHKGIEVLLNTFMNVPGRQLQLLVYGGGDPSYVQRLKAMTANDRRIHFMGRYKPDEVPDVYASIDVLVCASLCYESYSMVKYEAISQNTPVIVSNIGALPEHIVHKVNGFVFDPFHPETLADLLKELAKNPDKLKMITNQMQEINIATVEQEAFHYLQLYSKAIKH